MSARARRTRPPRRTRQRSRLGFTLIEMLAVMFLVSVVLTQAIAFYFDLTDAGRIAAARTLEGRRATTILDRVAHDLENSILVAKPPEVDPLDHPWLFVGEAPGEQGARRLRFVTRVHAARATASQVADVAIVTYALREADTGDLELWRSLEPGLPQRLERRIEPADTDLLLADGLEAFGVRFLTDGGDWKDDWDSTTVVDSSRLPRAAEILVALAPEAEVEVDPFAEEEIPARRFARRVRIPMRPLVLEELLEGANAAPDDDEEDADCVRVWDCIQADAGLFDEFDEEQIEALIEADACVQDVLPDVDPSQCIEILE